MTRQSGPSQDESAAGGVDPAQTLAESLIREHHEIDAGIAAFLADLERGEVRPEPLLRAIAALRRHIYLEETFLFPPIRAAGMLMPLLVMVREHDVLWDVMDQIEQLAGADAGDGDPERLLERCRSLLELLDAHNAKEEPIVYPRAALDLTAAERDALEEFLGSGRVPQDWTRTAQPEAPW